MYTEHYENGDLRVTFTSKEEYWYFLEVAEFKITPWAVRILDKDEFHLERDFPKSYNEYYNI